MTAFDYVVLAVLGVSVLISVLRGATREVMALASWIGATLTAIYFAVPVAGLWPAQLTSPTVRIGAAFVVVMLVSLLLFSLVSIALSQMVRKAGLTSTDRTLGAVFGLVRGVLILVVLVLLAGLTPLPREPAWRNAMFSAPLVELAIYVRSYLPRSIADEIRF